MAGSAISPYRKIRWSHWLPTTLAVALLPKCALCVAGYLAVAVGLGIATPELCGTVASEATSPDWGPGVSTVVVCIVGVWLAKFVAGLRK